MVRIDTAPGLAVAPGESLAREAGVPAFEPQVEDGRCLAALPGRRHPALNTNPGRAPGRTPAFADVKCRILASLGLGEANRFTPNDIGGEPVSYAEAERGEYSAFHV